MTESLRQDRMDLPPPDVADSLMARDLNELSLQEREEAADEIHGVVNNSKFVENPQAIAKALELLDKELKRIQQSTPENKSLTGGNIDEPTKAYCEALELDPSYSAQEDFRLMFLRAEGLDKPENAAARILKFFDIKKKLFGSRLYVNLRKQIFYLSLLCFPFGIIMSSHIYVSSFTFQLDWSRI